MVQQQKITTYSKKYCTYTKSNKNQQERVRVDPEFWLLGK